MTREEQRLNHNKYRRKWLQRKFADPVFRERINRKAREYYAAHREQRCAYQRNYSKKYTSNPVFKAARRKYYNKNKKRILGNCRAWRKNNPEYRRNWIEAKLKENPNYFRDQYQLWKSNNPEKYKAKQERKNKRKRKTYRRYRLRKIISDRVYLAKPEVIAKKRKAHRKRSWIIQRLIAMARDAGIIDQLRKSTWHQDIVEIRSRLTQMARDDGMYQLLSTEYDDGKRSL